MSVEIHTLLQEVMLLFLHTYKSQIASRQLSQKGRTGETDTHALTGQML